jgi:hypothetical protein
MHFRLIKICGRLVISIEYSTSKPCGKVNLSKFHLVPFLVRTIGSELRAKTESALFST